MPYYDDDGNELDPSMFPMPKMCLMCDKKDDPHEEIPCTINRLGQKDDPIFKCYAVVSLYGSLIDDIIEEFAAF